MRLRPTRSTRAELSFPTRCSSDLLSFPAILIAMLVDVVTRSVLGSDKHSDAALTVLIVSIGLSYWVQYARTVRGRSEEHTSELQSIIRISYADICLKKKIPLPSTLNDIV